MSGQQKEYCMRGVIAPFPRYELLKSPFTEFAFSPERDFAFEK
jgi:hypothetical protein